MAANDSYVQKITAIFEYGSVVADTQELSVQDVTTAQQVQTPTAPAQAAVDATGVQAEVGPSRLVLRKTVTNTSKAPYTETATINEAEPGDTLEYRIYYRNAGTGPVTELVINDTVPPYTTLLYDAYCGVVLSGMTCTASPLGLDDSLRWTFTGSLTGGAESSVSYKVLIDE